MDTRKAVFINIGVFVYNCCLIIVLIQKVHITRYNRKQLFLCVCHFCPVFQCLNWKCVESSNSSVFKRNLKTRLKCLAFDGHWKTDLHNVSCLQISGIRIVTLLILRWVSEHVMPLKLLNLLALGTFKISSAFLFGHLLCVSLLGRLESECPTQLP